MFLIVQAGLDRHMRVGRRKVISEFIQKPIAEKRSYFTSSPHQVWKIKIVNNLSIPVYVYLTQICSTSFLFLPAAHYKTQSYLNV